MSAIRTIPNLGPAMEAAFARAGLHTAEELHALGADAAYARLIEAGERPHFLAFCALALGLQGRPWTDLQTAEKPALRARFDALKVAHGPAPEVGIEEILDRIGVGRRQGSPKA